MPDRRKFLTGIALGAGSLTPYLSKANSDSDILEKKPWNQQLGDGVDSQPYGLPSKFESQVKRRNVEWLTATPVSSVNFTPIHELDGVLTPNGLCFERHHSGVAEINPSEHRLMINGLVDKQLVFTMEDLQRFPSRQGIHFREIVL